MWHVAAAVKYLRLGDQFRAGSGTNSSGTGIARIGRASVGLGAYGAPDIWQAPPRRGNPIAVAFNALGRGARSLDFWLLVVSFGICGFSTNGLINTHLIAYCADHGIPEIRGAGILARDGFLTDHPLPILLNQLFERLP